MRDIQNLLEKNHNWADKQVKISPDFFKKLTSQQNPKFLWIGCSDSRVPANVITDLDPGELFVHRNIANCFNQTDMNALSVLHYAIEVLKIEYVIVTGHYGCGGVKAALTDNFDDLPMHWVQPIRNLEKKFKDQLIGLTGDDLINRVCELNVKQQIENLINSSVIQKAWRGGSNIKMVGFIYDLSDGYLKQVTEIITNEYVH